MTTKKDLINVTIIGALVGLLSQPIIANLAADLAKVTALPAVAIRIGAFFGFLLLAPTALSIAEFIGKKIPVLYQFAKFAAVGSLNSFVDFGVLNSLIFLTGIAKGWGYSGFLVVSFLAATTNSFFWNKHWTFGAGGAERRTGAEAVKFYGLTTLVAFLSIGTASFVVNVIPHPSISDNLWANIGKLAGIFAGMFFNFLGYKFVVFKKPPTAP